MQVGEACDEYDILFMNAAGIQRRGWDGGCCEMVGGVDGGQKRHVVSLTFQVHPGGRGRESPDAC